MTAKLMAKATSLGDISARPAMTVPLRALTPYGYGWTRTSQACKYRERSGGGREFVRNIEEAGELAGFGGAFRACACQAAMEQPEFHIHSSEIVSTGRALVRTAGDFLAKNGNLSQRVG